MQPERVEYTQALSLPQRGKETVSESPSAQVQQIKVAKEKETRQRRKQVNSIWNTEQGIQKINNNNEIMQ